jgi:hypothetical protein
MFDKTFFKFFLVFAVLIGLSLFAINILSSSGENTAASQGGATFSRS